MMVGGNGSNVRNLWRVDDTGTLTLGFHEGQARAWKSEARFVFMLAGTQGGKTTFGPWWLWREIRDKGAGDYFAVTTTYDLFNLKMMPEMRVVFCNLLKVGRWSAGGRYLEIREGCSPEGEFLSPPWAKIILRSARVKESVEAATVKAAWLDECGMNMFKLNIWEAIQRRLSLHQGRVLGTTTIYNRGWLKSQVYDLWKSGDSTFDVIQFSSHINPSFPREEYDRMARILPQWKLRMFYQGLWDLPPGIIFDVFDPDRDAIAPRHIPSSWPVLVGIDPIGTHTTAIGFAFDEENGQLHLYDEYYHPYGRTTAEHVEAVLKKFPKHRVVAYVGGGPSERQARLDWQAAGLNLQAPPVYDVESGIDALYGLFKQKQLLVHRNNIHFIDELGTYSRPLDENDEPTAGIADKGGNDHCIDGARYAAVWAVKPGVVAERVSYQPLRIGRY